jgi:16S rRNA (uracil1498-N3)-methyltransferase
LTSDRFYIQKKQIKFPNAVLTGSEHHHLSRVVRKKAGERVSLFTEMGENFTARIDKIEKIRTLLTIIETGTQKRQDMKIILAPSLVKSRALELILQKSTELGVSNFVPVVAERSVVKISDKIEKKINRWERIVLAASKQCKRPAPPIIEKPLSLKKFLDMKKARVQIYLDEQGGEYLKDFVFSFLKENHNKFPPSVIILLGPEGGWTDREKQDIVRHGYRAVSLGRNILRSETAAISCVAIISHFWNP